MKKHLLDEPINAEARYLHGINVRLEETNELLKALIILLTPKQEVIPVETKVTAENIIKEVQDLNFRSKRKK